MNRNDLLYNLTNAIAYGGRIDQSYRDKYFKDPKAIDFFISQPAPLDKKQASFALKQLEKIIKAIHGRENGALESFLNQTLANAEYLAGRSAGKKTYRMIVEIGAEQKQKAEHPTKLQYIKDEDAYYLDMCNMVLRAGAGFFKVKVKDKTYKTVLRRSKKSIRFGYKEMPVRKALVKLLPYGDRTISEYLKEAKKLAVIDIDDKVFTKKLKEIFLIDCQKAGITGFVFPKKITSSLKEDRPSPKGILTYLLKNIKPQP